MSCYSLAAGPDATTAVTTEIVTTEIVTTEIVTMETTPITELATPEGASSTGENANDFLPHLPASSEGSGISSSNILTTQVQQT